MSETWFVLDPWSRNVLAECNTREEAERVASEFVEVNGGRWSGVVIPGFDLPSHSTADGVVLDIPRQQP